MALLQYIREDMGIKTIIRDDGYVLISIKEG
jgi:hypothetical protein